VTAFVTRQTQTKAGTPTKSLFNNEPYMPRNPSLEELTISPPVSPALLLPIAVASILSFALGYWIGVGNPSFGSSKKPHIERKSGAENRTNNSTEISSNGEADWTKNHNRETIPQEECKLVYYHD
jgi:hypothetical protein